MRIGDQVTRMLAGMIPQTLTITGLTNTKIICSAWEFDRNTLVEIDEDLGFGPDSGITGSYLVLPKEGI